MGGALRDAQECNNLHELTDNLHELSDGNLHDEPHDKIIGGALEGVTLPKLPMARDSGAREDVHSRYDRLSEAQIRTLKAFPRQRLFHGKSHVPWSLSPQFPSKLDHRRKFACMELPFLSRGDSSSLYGSRRLDNVLQNGLAQ